MRMIKPSARCVGEANVNVNVRVRCYPSETTLCFINKATDVPRYFLPVLIVFFKKVCVIVYLLTDFIIHFFTHINF